MSKDDNRIGVLVGMMPPDPRPGMEYASLLKVSTRHRLPRNQITNRTAFTTFHLKSDRPS